MHRIELKVGLEVYFEKKNARRRRDYFARGVIVIAERLNRSGAPDPKGKYCGVAEIVGYRAVPCVVHQDKVLKTYAERQEELAEYRRQEDIADANQIAAQDMSERVFADFGLGKSTRIKFDPCDDGKINIRLDFHVDEPQLRALLAALKTTTILDDNA